jgi:acyl dehydratase
VTSTGEPGEDPPADREASASEPPGWAAARAAIPPDHAERFTKTVGETDLVLFAGITGDHSPIHVDAEFARATRFGERIAHGALLVGFVSTVMARMTDRLPPPGGVSSRYEVTFVGPVRIGDTVTTELRLAETCPARRQLVFAARIVNQRGEVVLAGRTTLTLI